MAMKMPCVASPVGVNSIIIEHGVNGFLASSSSEWLECLSVLITNLSLREKMGSEGRKKIIQDYSVKSNTGTFLSLFQ
jgi:glycosyltransferase involved in cell wall biosynthesis